jgi:hypothetical protein
MFAVAFLSNADGSVYYSITGQRIAEAISGRHRIAGMRDKPAHNLRAFLD